MNRFQRGFNISGEWSEFLPLHYLLYWDQNLIWHHHLNLYKNTHSVSLIIYSRIQPNINAMKFRHCTEHDNDKSRTCQHESFRNTPDISRSRGSDSTVFFNGNNLVIRGPLCICLHFTWHYHPCVMKVSIWVFGHKAQCLITTLQ